MIVPIESYNTFLSEIKQPREFGVSRSITLVNKDVTVLVTIVGTDRGNLILNDGVYPIAFIKKDVEVDDKFLVKVNNNGNYYVYLFLKKMFEGDDEYYAEHPNAQDLLEAVLLDDRFKVEGIV